MKLSVVMSVYNGAATLTETLDSIAAQTFGDFELIVVDDGSSDATPQILASRHDPRLRVITQPNAGLTRALIRGCSEARGEFIARHDCGDRSLPERFARQLERFGDDQVVLTSCAVRMLGPRDELLYEVHANGDTVRRSLLQDGVRNIQGLPHHGTAMFRRSAYVAAGGYRAQFRFAQDLDLWIRMAAQGRIAIVDETLYEARYDPGAISATRRAEQLALTKVMIALRDGGDSSLLDRAAAIGITRNAAPKNRAAGNYFVASCLRRNGDMRYKRYARAAIRTNPLHWRAWLLLMR